MHSCITSLHLNYKFLIMQTVKDCLGTEISIPKNIKKIVSLVPSISELIYDLNSEDKLVGVTKFCVIPKYFQIEKTIVGGVQEFDVEKIKELNPDIVFASKDENFEEEIEELRKYVPVYVTDVKSIDEAKQMIANFGVLLNRRNDADKILMKIEMQLQDLAKVTDDLLYRSAAYFVWNEPWVAAGKDTFTDSMLKLIKVDNVFSNLRERYPMVTGANIHLGNPDIVMLPSEPFKFEDQQAMEISAHTHDAATYFVDGQMFSWYGSRLVKSLDYLKLLAVKFKEMN